MFDRSTQRCLKSTRGSYLHHRSYTGAVEVCQSEMAAGQSGTSKYVYSLMLTSPWKVLMLRQFYTNGPKPLKAWAFVSFDRYSDADVMQRYVDFLVRTLQRLGVVVENTRPPCIAPQDPRQDGMIEYQLKTAAQQAYKAGQCDPQLICVILPGK